LPHRRGPGLGRVAEIAMLESRGRGQGFLSFSRRVLRSLLG
jgi:hypothetical protein